MPGEVNVFEPSFYYSAAADRGHVAEQGRRIDGGRKPLSCPDGCPCEQLTNPNQTR